MRRCPTCGRFMPPRKQRTAPLWKRMLRFLFWQGDER